MASIPPVGCQGLVVTLDTIINNFDSAFVGISNFNTFQTLDVIGPLDSQTSTTTFCLDDYDDSGIIVDPSNPTTTAGRGGGGGVDPITTDDPTTPLLFEIGVSNTPEFFLGRDRGKGAGPINITGRGGGGGGNSNSTNADGDNADGGHVRHRQLERELERELIETDGL
jgi:hypothetical protein